MATKKSTIFFSFLFILFCSFALQTSSQSLPKSTKPLPDDQNIYRKTNSIAQENFHDLKTSHAQIAEIIALTMQKKAELLAQQNATQQLSPDEIFFITVYLSTIEQQIIDEEKKALSTSNAELQKEDSVESVSYDYWDSTDIMQRARKSKLVFSNPVLDKLIQLKRKFNKNVRQLRSYVFTPEEQLEYQKALVTEYGVVPFSNIHKAEFIATNGASAAALAGAGAGAGAAVFSGAINIGVSGITISGPAAPIVTVGFLAGWGMYVAKNRIAARIERNGGRFRNPCNTNNRNNSLQNNTAITYNNTNSLNRAISNRESRNSLPHFDNRSPEVRPTPTHFSNAESNTAPTNNARHGSKVTPNYSGHSESSAARSYFSHHESLRTVYGYGNSVNNASCGKDNFEGRSISSRNGAPRIDTHHYGFGFKNIEKYNAEQREKERNKKEKRDEECRKQRENDINRNNNSGPDKDPDKDPKNKNKGLPAAAAVNEAKKKIENILKDTIPGRETSGKAKQYIKNGCYKDAIKDFESLGPSNIRKIQGKEGMVGTLPDGRTINVRIGSTDKRPTLEILPGKDSRRIIKIRYGTNQP